MKISVSVVIPCYNREETIRRCIDSVMNQTVLPDEIIVVDDGSSDESVKIIEQMNNPIIKVIKQNHQGAQAARNLGILNAQGNYIAFLDSDDEWLPQLLEIKLKYLREKNAEVVLYGDGYVYDEKKKKKRLWKLAGNERDMYKSILLYQGPTFSSLIVKKKMLYKIGLLDEKVVAYQEWDTAIRLAKYCDIVHIKKPVFIYYLHEGETISKDKRKDILGYHYIVRKHLKEIIKETGMTGLFLHYQRLLQKCLRYGTEKVIIFGGKYFGRDAISKKERKNTGYDYKE